MPTKTDNQTWQRKVNHRTTAQTIRLMQHHPVTAHEVAEHVGLHIHTAGEFLRSLHKEKAAHIVGWEKDSLGRDCTAIFSLGSGRDIPRSAKTSSQRQAERRARAKSSRVLHAISGNIAAQ